MQNSPDIPDQAVETHCQQNLARRVAKWARRILIAALACLAFLALFGLAYQAIVARILERRSPPPGALIDVGSHRLHIHRRGSGNPAVVIDAGLSGRIVGQSPERAADHLA